MTILALQKRLKSLGMNPGPLDGIYGGKTEAAINEALDKLPGAPVSEKPIQTSDTSPVWGQPKASRRINEIIIHCAATPEGKDFTVADITRWHKERGFSTIGYHWVVYRDGSVHPGRREASIGAHVSGHNADTLGVCYIGGVDAHTKPKDTRTPAQKAALLDLVKALIAKYPTIKKVSGHNRHDKGKACPSFRVEDDPLSKLV